MLNYIFPEIETHRPIQSLEQSFVDNLAALGFGKDGNLAALPTIGPQTFIGRAASSYIHSPSSNRF